MEIKDLNKVQLILLALLLSFVTSIATGITTVTLMQQAPTSVTVPINRVVRETVEKIVSVEGKTTVQTVVVKEEDLVVDAISKNKSAVFKVTKGPSGNEVSAGHGLVLNKDGLIVADAVLVPGRGTYYVENPSGKFNAEFVATNEAGFSFLRITDAVEGTAKPAFDLAALGDISNMKAGQKVMVLGNPISSFIYEGNPEIDLSVTNSNAGGIVINLDGEVLGLATLNVANSFIAIDTISEAIPSATSTNSQ